MNAEARTSMRQGAVTRLGRAPHLHHNLRVPKSSLHLVCHHVSQLRLADPAHPPIMLTAAERPPRSAATNCLISSLCPVKSITDATNQAIALEALSIVYSASR